MKNKSISFTIFFILISCLMLVMKFSWQDTESGSAHVIESDGKGYYMYLPNLFITKNITSQIPDERFIFKTKNGAVNKYYVGTAVAMLPFFSAGYISATIWPASRDGYSLPFQKAVSIGALFYLCIGLIFMSRLLLLYDIKNFTICVTLLLITFGTNLLIYGVYHPSFSHIYSFAFITMFLFYAKKINITKNNKYAMLFAFAFGMTIIIRPSNGIIIFTLPFLAGSFADLKAFFKGFFNVKTIALCGIIFLSILSIQLYLWYLQTGSFFIWSYQNEGFYFLHPQILKTLFSFRKGFFMYTPLALLGFGGLVFVYKKNRFQFYTLTLFFLLLIYMTASWWCWYYGPSFGQRSFIEFYALNGLLLAILIDRITTKKIVYAAVILFTALNLIQSYQYVKNILSSWDMSFEKYNYVFLKTSPEYSFCLGGCDDIQPYSRTQTLLFDSKNDYEKTVINWSESTTKKTADEHQNVCDYSGKEFNTSFEILADQAIANHRLLFAKIQLDRLETQTFDNESPVMVITSSNAAGESYYYYTFALNEIPNHVSNQWKTQHYSVEIPKIKSVGDHLKIYIWNNHHGNFYVDNFSVKIYGMD